MGSVSEKLFALRPVTFRYKQSYDDGSKPIQYGLVAEDVADVFPELVVYGADGKPETVSYHLLAALLLNEVQKDHRVMRAQADRTETLEKQVSSLSHENKLQAARMAALERQVAALVKTAGSTERDRMVASAQ